MAVLNESGSLVLPGEHLDGDRPARRVGEQPVFDLPAAALAVPGVPEGGQLTAAALHPRAGQVEHGDTALGQMPGGQLLFDLPLPTGQPVHRGIDLIGAGIGHAQVRPQRGVTARPPARGGQLRLWPHRPRQHQRVGDVAFPAGRAEQVGQAQPRGHHVRRGDVPVRHRALHLERCLRVHQRAAFQRRPQRLDRLRRQARQVRQRLLPRPALLVAVGTAQQVRRVGSPLPLHRRVVATSLVHMHPAAARFHSQIQLHSRPEVQYLVATPMSVSASSSHVRPRISYPRSSKFRLGCPKPVPGQRRADAPGAGWWPRRARTRPAWRR